MSTVTEVQGLSICCAYDIWVTKLLSIEIWDKGEDGTTTKVCGAHTPEHNLKVMAAVQKQMRELGIVVFI